MHNQQSAEQTAEALKSSLSMAMAERGALAEKLEQNEKKLIAIRNAIQGVDLGLKLAAERQAKESDAGRSSEG
jgi:hypothetical protein